MSSTHENSSINRFRSSLTASQWQKYLPLAAVTIASQVEGAVTYTAVGTNVGLGSGAPGQVSTLTLDLPGINDMRFFDGTSVSGVMYYVRGLVFAPAVGGTYVRTPLNYQPGTYGAFGNVASTATTGQTIDDPAQTSRGSALVGGQDVTFATFYGSSFTDRYLMFQFKDSTSAGALRYGWVSLDFTLNGRNSFNAFIDGYAYDNSGAKIAAGAMPIPAGVPEPGTAGASLLLGAMITGAVGVRRRRKVLVA